MRILWLSVFSLLFLATQGFAQQVNTGNATAGNAANAGGGGGGVPGNQGGGGGTSDNLGAAFGERSTANAAEGFIGQNANAREGNFIGGNAAIAGGQFGNAGGVQGGGRGGGGGGVAGRGFQQQVQRTQARQIRTRLVLPADFAQEYRTLAAKRAASSITSDFRRINSFQSQSKIKLGSSRVFKGSNINVTSIGRIVTLRGQVRSERDRQLAGRIAKLEPGVDRVENLLQVLPGTAN